MIYHIILLKIKPGTEDEKVQALTKALNEISKEIPCVKKSSCGPNFSERNKEFTLGYLTEFESKEDLKKYLDDPYHVKVKDELILPITAEIVAVDYEAF